MLTRDDGWGVPSLGRVLIVDDDRDICDLVHAILTDEGFSVSMLHHQNPDALRVSVNQLEPDCVLLDGASPGDYGLSWGEAAWIGQRERPIPVIMFTAHRATLHSPRVASFTTPAGAFLQLYWWQRDGAYSLVRFALTGGRLETVGRCYDLGAAISVATTVNADPDTQSPVPQLSA